MAAAAQCLWSNEMTENKSSRAILDNGLTVIIREMRHAPVASLWMWFRVGSRNEIPGITGASHWVEHLMFKGSPKFPMGAMDRLLSREGGYNNAMTWIDCTAYYETLPAQRINLALEIEADRMADAIFDPREVESERTVVISERQGSENRPTFHLDEAIQAAAFRVHPYHHMVIGDACDLETMTRDDLHRHYQRYYAPNNAIAVIAGDVDTVEVQQKVETLFRDFTRGPRLSKVGRQEPEQQGERRVVVEGEGATAYVALAFHAPRSTDPDFFPCLALNAILSGVRSLSPFGGGGSNRSSRLYRALVETELAASVSGDMPQTIDPFLYTISATVRSGRSPHEVEHALWAEVERIAREPVSQEEMDKAIKQARAVFAYSSESVTSQGFWLGFAEILGDQDWYARFVDRLTGVTVQDIHQVAEKYLTRRNLTVGWYVPVG